MKHWLWLLLALGACGGTPTSAGARGDCAEGGALTGCPPEPATADGACDYLVECGAIPIQSSNQQFDYGACVDYIEGQIDDGEQLIIECIEASSCDALQVPGSPDKPDVNQMICLHFGGS